MPDYKEMYLKMFRAAEEAVNILIAAQRDLDGVSQKVLTDSLRSTEADGLVTRTVFPEVPPRVEYSLTDLGRSLQPILDAMRAWGESYKAKLRNDN